jgi:hypothetical protein
MIGFIGSSLQLQSVIPAHSPRLSKTRSIPYWTTSVLSSTVTNDERRITVHWILELPYESNDWLVQSESELLYDWRSTANQFVLAPSPLRLTVRFFFSQLNTCSHIPYIISSLTRGWICYLQLLLALTGAFLLGSEFRGTRDHILVSQIRDFPFCRLLRLAGLRWRYSTPPSQGKLTRSSLHSFLYRLSVTMESACCLRVSVETFAESSFTRERILANRCLAMVIFVTIYMS